MDWFKLGYTLLGGLGIFFFGMKQLSESLQNLGNQIIRKAINWLTNNRVVAVLVGLLITTLVQSSSITTVTIIGFVNAGLMNLQQAIGVIFGANIGTTITGWIIAIKVGKYGLVLIALGTFPYLFGTNGKWHQTGKLLFGLGMIFFGLQLMSIAFKPLRTDDYFLSYLNLLAADNLLSVIGCALIGGLMTSIIQSSSAMLGITMALATTGVISFPTACALVIGENIGTTITAFLASIGAGTVAKRAARSHILFNLTTALILIFVFKWYVLFIDFLLPGIADLTAPDGSKPHIAAHIAAFHTIFNITATCIFLPVLRPFANMIIKITPEKEDEKIRKTSLLRYVARQAPELAIEEAKREVNKMVAIVRQMLNQVKTYILTDTPNEQIEKNIDQDERTTDLMQMEITEYLSSLMKAKLNKEQTTLVYSLIRSCDELESVADYSYSIIKYRKRLFNEKENFLNNEILKIESFLDQITELFDKSTSMLSLAEDTSIESVESIYKHLNKQANKIKETYLDQVLDQVKEDKLTPIGSLSISDLIVALRRIKNHSLNIAQAAAGGKKAH